MGSTPNLPSAANVRTHLKTGTSLLRRTHARKPVADTINSAPPHPRRVLPSRSDFAKAQRTEVAGVGRSNLRFTFCELLTGCCPDQPQTHQIEQGLGGTGIIDSIAQRTGTSPTVVKMGLAATVPPVIHAVPPENGPYRTLGHRGSRNPPIQGGDGDPEVAGHVARRHAACEQLFG